MVRVLVADDEVMVRAGVKAILAAAPDIEVVAEAAAAAHRRAATAGGPAGPPGRGSVRPGPATACPPCGRRFVAQVLLAYLLGRRVMGQRAALWLFATVYAVGLLLLLLVPNGTVQDGLSLAGNVLLSLVLPWLAGQYMHQRAELARAGWQLAERLEQEQDLVADRVRRSERSRIAEDMHDSLGHELSLIALRAAALQVDQGLGPRQRQAAKELRHAAKTATGRLREVIGVQPHRAASHALHDLAARRGGGGAPAADDHL